MVLAQESIRGGDLAKPPQGLFPRAFRAGILPQEFQHLRTRLDSLVELRIGSGHVGAQLDQVLGLAVSRQGPAHGAEPCLRMLG